MPRPAGRGTEPDAIVIGAGPNGLVAANLLADAGWDVLVLEAQPEPGGAVRSGERNRAGFVHDRFSAFFPLAAVSPVFVDRAGGDRLGLGDFGLRWRRAPYALAHPTLDGRCAVIGADLETTGASLDAYAAGDGDGWRRLVAPWTASRGALARILLGPWPPVRAGLDVAARLGGRGTLDLARLALLPARRLAAEHFDGAGGALLVAGNGLHADISPESAGSGLFGWVLCCLAQTVGFPVPEGGAGALSGALVARLEAGGGQVRCGAAVSDVVVRHGRAVGVRVGESFIGARRAVVADVAAPHLYQRLLAPVELGAPLRADLRRFEWDPGTVKVDWALSAAIPWSALDARLAGTVHVADSIDELSESWHQLAMGRVPDQPMLLVGQQSMTDPTRQPPGTETAWAYTHVPRGAAIDVGGVVERMEARIEERAPGFGALILDRYVAGPAELEAADANLDGGAINGGTAQLHQQALLRPTPAWRRAATPIPGLYLASASAHPGGGVHGVCGANAARAALAGERRRRVVGWVR